MDGWIQVLGGGLCSLCFAFCPRPDLNVGMRRMEARVCPRSCPVGSFGSFSVGSFCFSCSRFGPWRAQNRAECPRPHQSFGSFGFPCPRPQCDSAPSVTHTRYDGTHTRCGGTHTRYGGTHARHGGTHAHMAVRTHDMAARTHVHTQYARRHGGTPNMTAARKDARRCSWLKVFLSTVRYASASARAYGAFRFIYFFV